ncbi:hypothetical protein [Bradyrhizobium sp. CSS354]|uniref:hypothetical protein n=1 Tax=Bradyrhizobium sp. CSS354 TaxID=2699172 RepID=UPI0023B14378|nr:hypothetical protein [Bradyrhizobium sp. CSS354]
MAAQQYGFIKHANAPETVHPSLWRQSRLINISALFEIVEGIYQVRNQDQSNMTIIEGSEGITIVDPLVSAETAKVALAILSLVGRNLVPNQRTSMRARQMARCELF